MRWKVSLLLPLMVLAAGAEAQNSGAVNGRDRPGARLIQRLPSSDGPDGTAANRRLDTRINTRINTRIGNPNDASMKNLSPLQTLQRATSRRYSRPR